MTQIPSSSQPDPTTTPAGGATASGPDAGGAPPRKRKNRPQSVLQVLQTERLTSHLHRLVLGGEGFVKLNRNEHSDSYVKLLLPAPGSDLEPPFDLDGLRESDPENLPVKRTYTVRRWDDEQQTITIDVVLHDEDGSHGIAASWAQAARPGDRLAMMGAGGGYTPDPATGFHLLIGDLSAQPAIAASLEVMDPAARGIALIQVEDAADIPEMQHPDGLQLQWLVGPREKLLTDLEGLDLPPAPELQVFCHGERGIVKQLRRELVKHREIPKDQLSISAYWALGRIEDQFQAEKREAIGRIED